MDFTCYLEDLVVCRVNHTLKWGVTWNYNLYDSFDLFWTFNNSLYFGLKTDKLVELKRMYASMKIWQCPMHKGALDTVICINN